MGEQPTRTAAAAAAGSGPLARPWRLWRPLWRHGERLGGWLFHLGALAVMHLITGGGYMVISRISAARGVTVWDPWIPLDKVIPTLGWTIFPYVSYYAYGVLTVLVTPRTPLGRQRLMVLYQGLIAMTLAPSAGPQESLLVRQASCFEVPALASRCLREHHLSTRRPPR